VGVVSGGSRWFRDGGASQRSEEEVVTMEITKSVLPNRK